MSRYNKYSDEPSIEGVYFQSYTRTADGTENRTNLRFGSDALAPVGKGGVRAPAIRALTGGAVAAMAQGTRKSQGEIMVYALLTDNSTVRLTELENVVVDEVRAAGGNVRRAPAIEAPRGRKRDEPSSSDGSSSESEDMYERRPRYIEAPRREERAPREDRRRERSESPRRDQRMERHRDDKPRQDERMERRRNDGPRQDERMDRRRQRSESPRDDEYDDERRDGRAGKRARFEDQQLVTRGYRVEEPEEGPSSRRYGDSRHALIPTGSDSYDLTLYRR